MRRDARRSRVGFVEADLHAGLPWAQAPGSELRAGLPWAQAPGSGLRAGLPAPGFWAAQRWQWCLQPRAAAVWAQA